MKQGTHTDFETNWYLGAMKRTKSNESVAAKLGHREGARARRHMKNQSEVIKDALERGVELTPDVEL